VRDHDGDPDMVWNEANAANDDGEAVMRAEREAGAADADPWAGAAGEDAELEARITALVKRWPQAIDTARDAVRDARDILTQLISCGDEELDTDAGEILREAWQRLNRVAVMAAARLKPVLDAEKDAELERLRAENAVLLARLREKAEDGR
jgi:hypothetical protein